MPQRNEISISGESRETVELLHPPDLALDFSVKPTRLAYAAAHVVAKLGEPGALDEPGRAEKRSSTFIDQIDWEATLAFRRYLWSLGLGVAEAMDTAQRSLIGWEAARELLGRTLDEARARRMAAAYNPKENRSNPNVAQPPPAVIQVIGGAGTDGLKTNEPTRAQLIDEYVRQGEFIQSRGGTVILLATPHLPRRFPEEASYVEVYSQVAQHLKPPLFIHWLGEMFAPDLAGYFPGNSFWRIMEQNADRIRGVKLSLLDKEFEIAARRRLLPAGQIVLTGDDYNYSELILGDREASSAAATTQIEIGGQSHPMGDFSHALLGVFDAIAPVAAKALEYLSRDDPENYLKLMEPTRPLAELIFEPPTENYKAGVVFLAYLNGHQDHFHLLGGLERRRSREHYAKIFQFANACGALRNPEDAAERMKSFIRKEG